MHFGDALWENALGTPARRNRLVFILLLVIGVALWAPGPGHAAVTYVPRIEGVEDSKLMGTLRGLSQLFSLEDEPPDTVVGLDQRARGDLDRLKPVLHGAGYWEAELDYAIDESAQPVAVTITVRPGPIYRLAKVELKTPTGGVPPPLADPSPAALGLKIGEPALTQPVVDAESIIAERYGDEGRPFAKVVGRGVVIDRATKEMTVTYTVDAGPQVRFGPHTVNGLERLDSDYVQRRVKWRMGDVYDARLVAQTRRALIDSGLFSSVRIDTSAAQADNEPVPLTIAVVERARRSIGAGLNYDTSQGIGSTGFWEHRNFFGGGESLRFQADLAQERLAALTRFRRPDVLRTDQDFLAEAELADEMPDSYESRKLRLFSGLERNLLPQLSVGAGPQFEIAEVEQKAFFDDVPSRVDYTLIGFPVYARFDQTDSKLDPTRGHRESFTVTPYTSVSEVSLTFVSLQAKASAYKSLDSENRYILAGFAGIGSIIGESTNRLPADKRLYAGGGGSVRGFGYQRAGPLVNDDLPTGGVSTIDFGVELRVKITEQIGIVPFFDAGSAYRSTLPKPGSDLFYGAGIGGRYYTPIGPLRVDVAIPLNKRSGDSPFQLYISIGHAF
jgi:translocation and assembly module TamA